MIKEDNDFDKYIEIWQKVKNTIKKINSQLIYTKKYLIAKETFNTKESFQCYYREVIPVPVILNDSVYGKDENYYPKVFFLKITSILMILMKTFQPRKFE